MNPRERIWVALDTPDPDAGRRMAATLSDHVGGFKIGLELFAGGGRDLVAELAAQGAGVFLDLKLHDIPNTVAGASAAIGRLGVSLFTVHALGGPQMVAAAVEGAQRGAAEAGHAVPRALAVTVLTSHDDASLERIGVAGPCHAAALRLARTAVEAGADGLVCSALEVKRLRAELPEALLVVPGVRPAGAAADDQARVATPSAAVDSGADLLVIGRPITRAGDPVAAAAAIAAELGA